MKSVAADAEVEDQTTKEWAAGKATRKAATTTKKAVSTAKKKVAGKVSKSLT